jgi:hypothetical protein
MLAIDQDGPMIEDTKPPLSVFWSLDTARKAEAIRCHVCDLCCWRDARQSVVCLYGGPYDGYQTPDGTPLAIADDTD